MPYVAEDAQSRSLAQIARVLACCAGCVCAHGTLGECRRAVTVCVSIHVDTVVVCLAALVEHVARTIPLAPTVSVSTPAPVCCKPGVRALALGAAAPCTLLVHLLQQLDSHMLACISHSSTIRASEPEKVDTLFVLEHAGTLVLCHCSHTFWSVVVHASTAKCKCQCNHHAQDCT